MRLSTVVRVLELDQVRVDNDLNPRQGALDQDVVFDYSAHVDDLPPMAVFELGGEYLLVAGFHRCAAHRLAQRTTARFLVHQGSREEAKEFADLDNLKHGKNLTRAERREVIRRQLKRHPDWSDVRLALACSTSDKTVRAVREEMERTSEIPRLDVLTGADGIERPRTVARVAVESALDERQVTFESAALLEPVEASEGRYQITSEPTETPAPWEAGQGGSLITVHDDVVTALYDGQEYQVPLGEFRKTIALVEDDAGEDIPDETGDDPGAALEIEAEQEPQDEFTQTTEILPQIQQLSGSDPVSPPPLPAPPITLPPPPPPVVAEAAWQITLTVRGEAPPLLMLMRGGVMERRLPEAVARRVIAVVKAAIEPESVVSPARG